MSTLRSKHNANMFVIQDIEIDIDCLCHSQQNHCLQQEFRRLSFRMCKQYKSFSQVLSILRMHLSMLIIILLSSSGWPDLFGQTWLRCVSPQTYWPTLLHIQCLY